MKTNCIIVHGCPSSPVSSDEYAGHWMPWFKDELIKNGIETQIALMPKPWAPEYSEFKNAIINYNINEDTILIGHSCGCAFLVRWLGETKTKVKKLILVAPWKAIPKNDEFRKSFYGYQIDRDVKNQVGEIVMFTSNNESEEGKISLKEYQNVLGGKIISVENMGHFTYKDMGKKDFPELLTEILN